MASFLDELRSQLLLMDGAMGTQLLSRLGRSVDRLERLNLEHPELVRAVHRDYVDAGARVLLTNTFLARDEDAIRAGVRLAREAIGTKGYVLGDIGPIDTTVLELQSMLGYFKGVDGLLIETASDVNLLAKTAVALPNTSLRSIPLLFSATYLSVHGEICTFHGDSPRSIAREATKYDIAALGVNCGRDMDLPRIEEVVRAYREETTLPLFARPNAGTPVDVNGVSRHPLTPEAFAAGAKALIEAGATMIGGCCGTSPEHLMAFKEPHTK